MSTATATPRTIEQMRKDCPDMSERTLDLLKLARAKHTDEIELSGSISGRERKAWTVIEALQEIACENHAHMEIGRVFRTGWRRTRIEFTITGAADQLFAPAYATDVYAKLGDSNRIR